MKNNNYSINEILNAVDNLLGSNATNTTQGETVKEMNEILSAVNKMHSKKVLEKINDGTLNTSEFSNFATMYSQFLDEKENDTSNETNRKLADIESDFKNYLYKMKWTPRARQT